MEHTSIIRGTSINVEKRSAIRRDDIEMQTALFQQAVEGLMNRNLDGFCDICEARGVVGESTDELKKGLVSLFESENHYKRRNKLQNQVTRG